MDNGIFVRQIHVAKVNSTAITSYVVDGIHGNNAFTTTTTTGTGLGGFLHVPAGRGKLFGTGDLISTGIQAALLSPLETEQRRR